MQDRPLTRRDIADAAGVAHHLIGCDLDGLDLSGLDLSGWTIERCGLRGTTLIDAMLESAQFLSCHGAHADFSGAHLDEARFQACDFNNGSFRRARLSAAVFIASKLTGADFTDARAMDLHVEESLLIGAIMPGFGFLKQVLRKVDFGQADLRKCDFRHAVLIDCSLRDANMAGARFEGADLRACDLGGLRLMEARLFRGATISRDQAGQLLGELGLNVR